MRDFNIPEFTVIAQQIDSFSGRTTFRHAYLVLDNYNSELIIDFNITNNKCFNNIYNSDYYYQLAIYYDITNLSKLWTISLKVNDLECNDFFLEKNSEYQSLQHFIHKYLLQDKLSEKLKEKPSIKQKKI